MDLIQTDQNAAQVLAWSVLSKGMVSLAWPIFATWQWRGCKTPPASPGTPELLITALVSEVPYDLAMSGKSILFVGTKKQAQESIAAEAQRCNMFYVNNRWLGGMLTNFKTMRGRVDRLNQLKKMQEDGTFDMLPKKEVIKHMGEIAKLEKYLAAWWT